MKLAGLYRFALFGALAGAALACASERACVFDDSSWGNLRAGRRDALFENPPFADMDQACLVAMVQRWLSYSENMEGRADTAVGFVRRYALLYDSLSLNAFYRLSAIFADDALISSGSQLADVWVRHNGSFRAAQAEYGATGQFHSADSLYEALARLHAIDVFDLSQWAQIKGVLEDYDGAAEVFCMVSSRDERLTNMVHSQLERLLDDADGETRRRALRRYFNCFIQSALADTAALAEWLSSVYDRYGLYDEEIALITRLGSGLRSEGRMLLLSAKRRFSQQLFRQAVEAALPAYQALRTDSQKKEAAVLLYHAYTQLSHADSALFWFDKADVDDIGGIGQAVVLYQRATMFAKADSLLRTLPESMVYDTLAVRQLLFRNQPDRACALASQVTQKKTWSHFRDESVVWQVRTAVFAGKMQLAQAHLDTARIMPSSEYAQELLRHKLVLIRLKTDPAAFPVWARIQYARYVEQPAMLPDSAAIVSASAVARELAAPAAVTMLLEHNRVEAARAVCDGVTEKEASPEIWYLFAQTLLRAGELDRARSVLEQLLLDHPEDVFSEKARIYLMKLERESAR